jgi:hypothetical protein
MGAGAATPTQTAYKRHLISDFTLHRLAFRDRRVLIKQNTGYTTQIPSFEVLILYSISFALLCTTACCWPFEESNYGF